MGGRRSGGSATPASRRRRPRVAVGGLVATATALVAAACVSPPSRLADDPADGQVASCAAPAAGADFERVSPGSVGLDRDRLRAAVDYAGARAGLSVRVYRHGCLVADGGLDPAAADDPYPAFSMTKSVVSLAVGRAVTLGHLSVDDPVGPHLRARGLAVDDVKGALTVRQFLTETSGIRMNWVQDLNDAGTEDSVQALLRRPFEAVPGTTFLYAQTAVTLLTTVVEGATGRDFQEFVATELFEPVGITGREWRWARDVAGRTQGFAWLDMSPRAFARLGMLAADGRWDGRRLLSAEYLDQATYGSDANPCYGFLIRSNRRTPCENDGVPSREVYDRRWLPPAPEDTFGFSGAFDQETTVYPSLDMVVVRMGPPGFVTPDPLGDVKSQRPRWQYRFARILMTSVLDQPQPAVPDWTPDPEPGPIDLFRILPLPMPEPWPPRT